eukprot:scaffold721_cov131-Cylindrotheca_fusiformis.AAC.66
MEEYGEEVGEASTKNCHVEKRETCTEPTVSRQTGFSHSFDRKSVQVSFSPCLGHLDIITLLIEYLQQPRNKVNTMKFALPVVIAATCAAPVAAETFIKEQFNDDVSQILPRNDQLHGEMTTDSKKIPVKGNGSSILKKLTLLVFFLPHSNRISGMDFSMDGVNKVET